MSLPIRVAIVEDDIRYRDSLEQVLREFPGVAVAACHPAAAPALQIAEDAARADRRQPWDVVLMDLEMPGIGGIEATRRLKAVAPGVRIIILTVFEHPGTILEAICAGADGYVLKKTRAAELVEGIQNVMAGGATLTPDVARRLLEVTRYLGTERRMNGSAPSRLELTEREQQVLRGLVEGLSYKQVGGVLGIGLGTVRNHITHIYRKLQVHSVAEAVARALRERLV